MSEEEKLEDLDILELNRRMKEGEDCAREVETSRKKIRDTLRRKLAAIGAELKDELPQQQTNTFRRALPLSSGDGESIRSSSSRQFHSAPIWICAVLSLAAAAWSMGVQILGGLHLPELPVWAVVSLAAGLAIILTFVTLLCFVVAAAAWVILRPQTAPQFVQSEPEAVPPWDRRFIDRGASLSSGVPFMEGPVAPFPRNVPVVSGDPALDTMLAETKEGIVRPASAYAHLNNGLAPRFQTDDL